MLDLARALAALLRRPSPCEWVSERLVLYQACDPSLRDRDYTAIDAHLSRCSACAAEHAELETAHEAVAGALYPAESLPEIDYASMARAIVAGAGHIQGFEPLPEASSQAGRWRLALGAAAGLLLVLATPVLAHVASNLWQASTTQPGAARTHSPATGTAVPSITTLTTDPSASLGLGPIGSADAEDHAAPGPQLERLLGRAAARLEIGTLSPGTEAEYEAWARAQYPHIMWLYDVLMGKAPKEGPSGHGLTPAQRMVRFGVSENGNPTIAISQAGGKPAAFELQLPVNHVEGQALWDGIPVSIPEWAEALYVDTPAIERPQGWRALLVYSGEAFAFDWPQTAADANVRPCLEAVCDAALAAGWISSSGPLARPARQLAVPDAYFSAMTRNHATLDGALVHVAVSARLVGTPEFCDLAQSAEVTRAVQSGWLEVQCVSNRQRLLLDHLFDSREALLRSLGAETDASGNGWLSPARPRNTRKEVRDNGNR